MAMQQRRSRRRSPKDEHGQLQAARIILADAGKAQGCTWLIEWARRTVTRYDSVSAEPSKAENQQQLFLVS
jgi:hypothetical protein